MVKTDLISVRQKPETLPKGFGLVSLMIMLAIFCSNVKTFWCLQAAVDPLQLGTATHDPTMVSQYDTREWSRRKRSGKGSALRVTIKFFSIFIEQNNEGRDIDTRSGVHSLVGLILGDFQYQNDFSLKTFVLVAQQKENSYERVGHMVFMYKKEYAELPKISCDWVLDVPNMAYPFRNKSIRRIRLG